MKRLSDSTPAQPNAPTDGNSGQAHVETIENLRNDASVAASMAAGQAAAFITFEDKYVSDARVLAAETSQKLNRFVGLGGCANTPSLIPAASSLIILLTKEIFVTLSCVTEIYAAIRANVRIIPVLVDSAGYDFSRASRQLSSLEDWFCDADKSFQSALVERMRQWPNLPEAEATMLQEVQKLLYTNVMPMIAIPWQPQGGPNHYVGMMNDIQAAVPAEKKTGRRTRRMSKFANVVVTATKMEAEAVKADAV